MLTSNIDEVIAQHCFLKSKTDLLYGVLASSIIVSNNHKTTQASFAKVMNDMYDHRLVSDYIHTFLLSFGQQIDEMLQYSRDYLIDYFGFKTMEKSYLTRINKIVVERPQHVWMRCALEIHVPKVAEDYTEVLTLIKETYDLLSQKYFTHATPTLFNSCSRKAQLSSCYLVSMQEDSIHGIYSTLLDCAMISKYSGGIGLHIHNIRSNGTYIQGTNGVSQGIVPMLRVYNTTARYVDQGGGKRNGSIAIYLETWHPDIFDFLNLKKNTGDEEKRARDLFYALWVSDLFMERVESGGQWSLFCPNECPNLSDTYGAEFTELYTKYEQEGRARKTVDAKELWLQILDSQMETGTPYICYKDNVNNKSNQKNIGIIKSSNLCTEIMQYSDKEQTAVCNLASIGLPTFVDVETKTFNYDKLHEVVKVVTNNLNNLIDKNFYPIEKARVSNLANRPIGIGIQGLADTFMLLDIPFHSALAMEIDEKIAETMYHAALEKSCELSIIHGPYSTFEGSPASQGILQFDLWHHNKTTKDSKYNVKDVNNDRYDWDLLRDKIKTHGLRNSLLVALMPTASTSQILGFNECFEPFTSNIYTRRTLAGEFLVVNKYLIKELTELGYWNEDILNNIIVNNGSIQQLSFLPEHIRNKYKIVWEIPMKHIIDMSAERGKFICQSQSLNLWMEDPVYKKLTSMHFYAWKRGLKTGIYYLRRKAKHQMQQFIIEPPQTCENCSA